MTIAPMGDRAGARGEFDARYLAFLTTVADLRPSLHRYCARMTGSVADGEDVVQDALFDAYRRLESFDGTRPLKPWLFRIAHNRCVDFLRHRGVREDAESTVDTPDGIWPDDPPGPARCRAGAPNWRRDRWRAHAMSMRRSTHARCSRATSNASTAATGTDCARW